MEGGLYTEGYLYGTEKDAVYDEKGDNPDDNRVSTKFQACDMNVEDGEAINRHS